jgi:acetyl/propionyl-CoA carboxylase alpha subunit
VDGAELDADLVVVGGSRVALRQGDRTADVVILPALPRASVGGRPPGATSGFGLEVLIHGWRLEIQVEPAAQTSLRARAQRVRSHPGTAPAAEVRAIIPGRVASLAVEVGQRVEAGQTLLIVEAMKMQNEIRAPRAGIVRGVAVAAGQVIDAGALLIVIE